MSLNIPPMSQGWVGGKKFFLCCFANLMKRRGQGNMRLNCARKNSQIENKQAYKTWLVKLLRADVKNKSSKTLLLGWSYFYACLKRDRCYHAEESHVSKLKVSFFA